MNFEPMKDFMDRLTTWRIPGNCVSVCIGNKEVFTYCSGYSDYERKIPMEQGLLFNIYSCSKIATVVSALQLYEKGYFLLDDPLYLFIPKFKEMYIKNVDGNIVKAKNPITLRHLFTMTSGFTYDRNEEIYKKAKELTNGKMDTLKVVKCIAEDFLAFEPGSKWNYGISHDILAAVVEVVSGMKFRDYVKANIFEPLGMNDSYYHNEAVIDRVAKQYRYENTVEQDAVKLQMGSGGKTDGKIVEITKSISNVFELDNGCEYDNGGGGITTSVSDYSRFASALACGGIGQTGEKILSPGTIDLMRTNQLNDEQLKYFSWPQLKGYGYGLGVRTLIDKAQSGTCGNLGEFGWGGAAGATVLVDTDLKLSMFYTHHMLNPQEEYYQPRIRNILYTCI